MVNQKNWLVERFEEHRTHLRAVAYRILGSVGDADDAVQETWLRLSRSDVSAVENMRGWLTTVTARVCLNILRSRQSRREEPIVRVPEPIVSRDADSDPEREALIADSVGLALLVVLETLAPAERLAFVLHDMFGVPFEEIAAIVDRTPDATRQLASRARRRVRGAPVPDPDLARQRQVVNAFLRASRAGDFEALIAVLGPDVVLHADRGDVPAGGSRVVRGARAVAEQAAMFAHMARWSRPALVNGAVGFVVFDQTGQLFSILGFTVAAGKILQIDVLADPERLRQVNVDEFHE